MTMQTLFTPSVSPFEWDISGASSATIDATGERVEYVVRVPKTGNITHVLVRIGSVTTAQDVDVALETLTAGDASGTNYGGSTPGTIPLASVTANTWREVALATQASATIGDYIAIAVDFTSTIGNISINCQLNISSLFPYTGAFAAAAWARSSAIPMCALKYDDGSYGLIGAQPGVPASSTFGSGSTPDERALRFTVPYLTRCWGLSGLIGVTNTSSDFDIVLYQGTTVLATKSMTAANTSGTGSIRRTWVPFDTPQDIAANTVYYLSVKPTSANTVLLRQLDYFSNAVMGSIPQGIQFYLGTRTDAGAWTDTTTSRPNILPMFDQFSDVATSSGGGFIPMHSE